MESAKAPALERGIEILRLFNHQKDYSLDEVASGISAPKASVSRLLNKFVGMGVLEREASSKRFHALQMLVPLNATLSESRMVAFLDELSVASSRRAEFYQVSAEGMVLSHLSEAPGSEVSLVAKTGFIRRWGVELEAVTAVAYAFFAEAPALKSGILPAGRSPGVRLSRNECKQLVESCFVMGGMVDGPYNTNGVRRLALPILGRQNALVGIIALVETALQLDKHLFQDLFTFTQQQIKTSLLKEIL